LAQSPGPVCPQLAAAEAGRAANLTREQAALLANQAEDCLTLNIYVPHQAEGEFFTNACIVWL
jgi:carboxylesterase type B